MTVDLAPARWWHIPVLAAIDADLFGADAWSPEVFWSELAGVPASRWYRLAVESGGPPAPDVDRALVGYVGLAVVGETADVQTLAVRPERQERGLGGLLLDALLAEAVERGCTEVLLEVRADNSAAHRLYTGRGFAEIALRRRYYEDGSDAAILRKALL